MVWHRTDTYKNIPYKINLDQSNFVESVASRGSPVTTGRITTGFTTGTVEIGTIS